MRLTDADFARAAKALGCDDAAIRAVAEVESFGKGFLPNGIPVMLFEAHIFSRLTEGKYDLKYPDISSRTWNRKLYATGKDWIERGTKENQRLEKASSLDRTAALQSASYGLFQVMGFNWKLCGYANLQSFINDVWRSEGGQLNACVGFIKAKKLDVHLRNKDWAKFALGYNGSGYKMNKYDEKLAAAYKRNGGV